MPNVNVKVSEGVVAIGLDANQDGQNSITLKINSKEGLEELFAKGEAKIEVKTLSLKLEGTKIVGTLDTDKDGECVATLEADLLEGYEEAAAAFKK